MHTDIKCAIPVTYNLKLKDRPNQVHKGTTSCLKNDILLVSFTNPNPVKNEVKGDINNSNAFFGSDKNSIMLLKKSLIVSNELNIKYLYF